MKNIILVLLMIFGLNISAIADTPPAPEGIVVQANGDRNDFKNALLLALNMQEVLSKTAFEVVVFGNNVKLLSAFSDELPIIQKALDRGIQVIACGRSLKSVQLEEDDLSPGVAVVPFGAVHIVYRQKEGWQYIKE